MQLTGKAVSTDKLINQFSQVPIQDLRRLTHLSSLYRHYKEIHLNVKGPSFTCMYSINISNLPRFNFAASFATYYSTINRVSELTEILLLTRRTWTWIFSFVWHSNVYLSSLHVFKLWMISIRLGVWLKKDGWLCGSDIMICGHANFIIFLFHLAY